MLVVPVWSQSKPIQRVPRAGYVMEAPLRQVGLDSWQRAVGKLIPISNPAEHINRSRVVPIPVVLTQHPIWMNLVNSHWIVSEEERLRGMYERTVQGFCGGESIGRMEFASTMHFNQFGWSSAAIGEAENVHQPAILYLALDVHNKPRALRNNEGLYVQEGSIGGFLGSIRLDDKPPQSDTRYYQHGYIRPIRQPIKFVSSRSPLNRDVCGGEFADRYGGFFLFGGFAIGIIFELIALTILFNNRKSRCGWILAAISLFFWIMTAAIVPIGRLPWDWWKTPKGCQDDGQYYQTFQHNPAIVPQKPLDLI